jgi:uncharacterized delta-60 repeat protein
MKISWIRGVGRQPSFARTAPPFVLALLLLPFAFPAPSALAAGGELDPSFGRDGRVTTRFSADASGSAVAIQTDGKIVAAGGAGAGFALARYDTDGSLDTTFGTNGKVTTGFSDGAFTTAVAVQSDGKIVAAGGAGGFALARYDTDGSLDTTFGTGGTVTTSLTSGDNQANGVAIQADGRIVAAGFATPGSPWRHWFALARYRSDGTLDTSFGDGGIVLTRFGVSGVARAVVLQSNQKIVAAGTNGGGFALARYDSDGSLDTSFGNAGKVAALLPGDASGNVYAVALQPDGKIVAAGSYDFFWFALARFNLHGGLDRTFGHDGFVITDVGRGGEQWVSGLVIRPSGKVVAAGSEGPHEGGEAAPRFVLTRYRANGVLDPTFGGGDGKVVTRFKNGASAGGVVALADALVVVVGSRAGRSFALARYLL